MDHFAELNASSTRSLLPHLDQHVARRLRERRQELSIPAEAIDAVLGVTAGTFRSYERGQRHVTAARLFRIAALFGVEIDYFFADTGEIDEKRNQTDEEAGEERAFAEAKRFLECYARVSDSDVRRRVLELIRSMADRESVPLDLQDDGAVDFDNSAADRLKR